MRILHVSNHATLRCGVAEFGRQFSAALREAGHEVDDWEGGYPSCYRRGYWPAPEVLATYDVVHLNWQPNVLNHYQPEVYTAAQGGPLLSIFLHDLPPWSSYALVPYADVVSALEPGPGVDVVIPPPCLAYTPPSAPLYTRPTIGRTGIGDAGRLALLNLCERQGWDLSDSLGSVWMSNENEIDRLARCWVNVVWYHEDRSRSSAASIVATARRPTVLSRCTRFDHLKPWAHEFTWAKDGDLEPTLVRLMEAVAEGAAMPVPCFSVEALQWPGLITPLLEAWQEAKCAS